MKEKHPSAASPMPPAGGLARNSGVCPDLVLNQRPFGSQVLTQSTEPHQPGLKIFIYLFLERGEGREKNINVWLPFRVPLLGTWPKTQPCTLTGNCTGNPLVHRLALHPLSHTSQGVGPQHFHAPKGTLCPLSTCFPLLPVLRFLKGKMHT